MHISNGIENGYSAASIPRKSPSGKRSKRGMKIIDSEVEKHLLYGKETTLWNLHTPATQNCESINFTSGWLKSKVPSMNTYFKKKLPYMNVPILYHCQQCRK